MPGLDGEGRQDKTGAEFRIVTFAHRERGNAPDNPVENKLTDEHDDDVKPKEGAHVTNLLIQ